VMSAAPLSQEASNAPSKARACAAEFEYLAKGQEERVVEVVEEEEEEEDETWRIESRCG
jgi:hypothetical protein